MTAKEKFDFWWTIIFLAVFGLATGAAAIYTLIAFPITVLTIIYALGMGSGSVFSFVMVRRIYKEYKYWSAKEKEKES